MVLTWRSVVAEAIRGGIEELARFARELQEGLAAVTVGLTLEWSNGPVEGQITRLKLLKRQGYGRAGSRSYDNASGTRHRSSGKRATVTRTRRTPASQDVYWRATRIAHGHMAREPSRSLRPARPPHAARLGPTLIHQNWGVKPTRLNLP